MLKLKLKKKKTQKKKPYSDNHKWLHNHGSLLVNCRNPELIYLDNN